MKKLIIILIAIIVASSLMACFTSCDNGEKMVEVISTPTPVLISTPNPTQILPQTPTPAPITILTEESEIIKDAAQVTEETFQNSLCVEETIDSELQDDLGDNFIMLYTEEDVITAAKMLAIEQGYGSFEAQCACVWTACWRVDAGIANSVSEAIKMPYQYTGYNANNEVRDDLVMVAINVLTRWSMYHQGVDVAPEIPSDFLWFSGDGSVNTFRNTYSNTNETQYIKFVE